jgi:membrane-bound lytic murein transglycosylase D
MKTAASALIVALVLVAPRSPAGAQTSPVHPGRQTEPPAPPAPSPPPLVTDPQQRRAIRGCGVDEECLQTLQDGLREFEMAEFPRGGSDSPWLDEDDPLGRQARAPRDLERNPTGSSAAAAPEGPPSRRWPQHPWLDELDMPDLPVRWHEHIVRFLVYFKEDPKGRRLMAHWLRNQGRFRDLIVSKLRAARLPEDLLYVVMIESSYDPTEISRVGASGLWQFMPAGGRIYGLEIDRWLDERNDPVRSTDAAVLYFRDLFQRFGNWDLALAAYNVGYGAVLNTIAKYNTNDFWLLTEYENALPWGTSLYVPKALAAAIIGRNRARFGFDRVDELPPFTYETVTVPRSVPLDIVARAAGAQLEEIQALNPQLPRRRTPPGRTDYVVRIPGGRAALFAERLPQLRGDWDTHDAYVVAHGERFEDVAAMHGLTPRALRELNELDSEIEVAGGTVLVVPRVSAEEKARNLERAREDLYVSGVPRGRPGDRLLVAVPDLGFKLRGKRRVFYRVVAGDSLFDIARAFRVSRQELARWNRLDPDAHVQARMVLQVWIDRDFDPEKARIAVLDDSRLELVETGSARHLDLCEERVGRRRVVYRAEKTISLEDVGKRYGLSSRDLGRINRIPHSTVLQPGDTVVVYEVVDQNGSERAARQARDADSYRKAQRPRRKAPKRPQRTRSRK